MEREYFTFYRSFYEAVKDLPKDIRLEVLTAIVEYGLYGTEPTGMKPFTKSIFTLVRPNIDANRTRFENGKKGGRKSEAKKDVAPVLKKETAPAAASVPPPPVSTPVVPVPIDESVAALLSDKSWNEPVCMRYHLSPEQFPELVGNFRLYCISMDKHEHMSLSDAKRHFCNLLAKGKLNEIKSDNKSSAAPADYTFDGGFGGQDN